jgi:hypothetical protein
VLDRGGSDEAVEVIGQVAIVEVERRCSWCGRRPKSEQEAYFLARRWLISRFAAAEPRASRPQLPLALGVAARPGSSAACVESIAAECSSRGASSRWRMTTA